MADFTQKELTSVAKALAKLDGRQSIGAKDLLIAFWHLEQELVTTALAIEDLDEAPRQLLDRYASLTSADTAGVDWRDEELKSEIKIKRDYFITRGLSWPPALLLATLKADDSELQGYLQSLQIGELDIDSLVERLRDHTTPAFTTSTRTKAHKNEADNPSDASRAELRAYGKVLTEIAEEEGLTVQYEREQIVETLVSLLSDGNHHTILVGDPGVGKSTILKSLAGWIVRRDPRLPASLAGRDIVECNLTTLLAGIKFVGELEERINALVETVQKQQAILVLDNFHNSLTAGAGGDAEDRETRSLSARLQPYLEDMAITVIATTTIRGYDMIEQRDPALSRRFKKVEVPPTSIEETLEILQASKDEIDAALLQEIVEQADRLLPVRRFPGKAFDLMSGVMLAYRQRSSTGTSSAIQADDVDAVICSRTGLRREVVSRSCTIEKQAVREFLSARIYGQDSALDEMATAILRFKQELNDRNRPAGVFLFVGPSGTGKTQIAHSVAEYLFGDADRLLRYNMGRYGNGDRRLFLGGNRFFSGPGYLLNDVIARPVSVILFDEIEKAGPAIRQSLLSVIGEGILADDNGNVANFTNSIIIMTSNVGSQLYNQTLSMGFRTASDAERDAEIRARVEDALEKEFSYEFVGRTNRVHFQPLSRECVRRIALKEVESLADRPGLRKRNTHIQVTDAMVEHLIQLGYNTRYGARPMQHAIDRVVVNTLAEQKIPHNTSLQVDYVDGEVSVAPTDS